ncbi:MAG: hypothetical protein ACFB12_18240, partial [Leptolyngbyaceae cyanobacterium]
MIVFPTKKFANSQSRHWRWLCGIILTGLGCAACSPAATAPEVVVRPEPPVNLAAANRVVALGRLVPKGEVIQLSVPNAEDSRVNQILVTEGDFVEAGQVIA